MNLPEMNIEIIMYLYTHAYNDADIMEIVKNN